MLEGRVVVGVDNGVCATLSARYSRSSSADGGQCPAGKGSIAGGICDILMKGLSKRSSVQMWIEVENLIEISHDIFPYHQILHLPIG